jgi:hypothetical protein
MGLGLGFLIVRVQEVEGGLYGDVGCMLGKVRDSLFRFRSGVDTKVVTQLLSDSIDGGGWRRDITIVGFGRRR